MADIAFDPTAFRAQYPAFADPAIYPDATLNNYFTIATAFIDADTCPFGLDDMTTAQRTLALNLLVAHLATIGNYMATGEITGILQGATIDKVNVTLTPPPVKNMFNYWLATTPYGQQLLALLELASVGGFYIGGWPEIGAFRRAGGYSGCW